MSQNWDWNIVTRVRLDERMKESSSSHSSMVLNNDEDFEYGRVKTLPQSLETRTARENQVLSFYPEKSDWNGEASCERT